MAAKLDGVRVLDVSRVLAGPYCTMMLADLGAEVIKVEPPWGDETRTWPPFYENGDSGYYFALNRNKKGIVLDLKQQEGRDIILQLAEKSHVFIENFTPGVVKKLGIDYESISRIRPDIIYCSISGFGQHGPYRNKRAYDPVIQAMGGAMSVTGVKDGEPVKIGIPIGDMGGSLMAVISVLSSLFAREKHGCGDYIDISMLDCQVALLSIMAAEYFASGKVPKRLGLEHPWRVPSKTFRTKDGYITTSATSGTMYAKLCKCLGVEELIDDPRFKTNVSRVENREILYPILEDIMVTKTSSEWEQIFNEAGLPNGVMKDMKEVFSDPHVLEREMLETVEHQEVGALKMIGVPFKFLQSEKLKMTPPPMMGEHTQEVLEGLLGYNQDEIALLKQKDVITPKLDQG